MGEDFKLMLCNKNYNKKKLKFKFIRPIETILGAITNELLAFL